MSNCVELCACPKSNLPDNLGNRLKLVSMLHMKLYTLGPGFEQKGANLQLRIHCLKMVVFKRLEVDGLIFAQTQ